MTFHTICQEAYERLLAAEEAFGDLPDLWRRVAERVSERTGLPVTAEAALWVAIEASLERYRRCPQTPELREAVGYLDMLARLHTLASSEAATRPTRRVP